MSSTHWGYGAVGGAALGWYYGDSPWEIAAGAALTTPWGVRTMATTTQSAISGISWAASTRAGFAARGAAVGAARFAGSVMLAVAIPVAAGYAASHMIAGQRGRSDYVEFMTGGVSPKEWFDAVTLSSMR